MESSWVVADLDVDVGSTDFIGTFFEEPPPIVLVKDLELDAED